MTEAGIILLIEELELIVSKHVSAALKDELGEQHMPERLIVVANSNSKPAHFFSTRPVVFQDVRENV